MFKKILDAMGFVDNDEELEEYEEVLEKEDSPKRKGQLVALPNNRENENMKVKVIAPTTFDETQKIADNLKEKKAVVINLEEVDLELATRIVDFVAGTTYAISGSMQKIGECIILVVPANIDIDGALKDVELGGQNGLSWVSSYKRKETTY